MDFKELTEKQTVAWDLLQENKHREIMFDGGARAGKTFLIIMYFIIIGLQNPGMRILIARLRFAHAKASLWKQTLMPMIKSLFGNIDYKEDRQDYILSFSMPGQTIKSEIWLGGLDDKDRTDKILGHEYAIIFLNEVIRIAESTVDKVRSRLAQKVPGFKNFAIYDCNPGHPLHYMYQRFYIEKDPSRTTLHWMPEDNRENLNEGYIEEILDKLKGAEKTRLRDGKWAALPGAVYENIKAEHIVECVKDFNGYDDFALGLDFGLNTVITLWGIKDGGRDAYCVAESCLFGSQDTITANIIKKLDEMDEIYYIKKHMHIIYADHEPDRIQEIENAGYTVKKAYKNIEPGDASVNSFNLYFDTSCSGTFQSMLNLRRQQDSQGNFIEKHVKENDHAADSSRYSLHGWKMDNGQVSDGVYDLGDVN